MNPFVLDLVRRSAGLPSPQRPARFAPASGALPPAPPNEAAAEPDELMAEVEGVRPAALPTPVPPAPRLEPPDAFGTGTPLELAAAPPPPVRFTAGRPDTVDPVQKTAAPVQAPSAALPDPPQERSRSAVSEPPVVTVPARAPAATIARSADAAPPSTEAALQPVSRPVVLATATVEIASASAAAPAAASPPVPATVADLQEGRPGARSVARPARGSATAEPALHASRSAATTLPLQPAAPERALPSAVARTIPPEPFVPPAPPASVPARADAAVAAGDVRIQIGTIEIRSAPLARTEVAAPLPAQLEPDGFADFHIWRSYAHWDGV
jgi:hypothetical protein